VRAILGQQVSVAAARTLAARLAQRFGQPLAPSFAPGLEHLFPTPEALADADLATIGLTRARADTVRAVARAMIDGRVDFRTERTLEDFAERWVALPGIGPWTAQYIALRALGHPDAFPAEDLVLQRAVPGDGSRLGAKALLARAEAWRPWRGYAVIQLWRDSMTPQPVAVARRHAPSRADRSPRATARNGASPA
jgi:AraC family transcriptional regulator of adaptative response / DNA-3-methyladenine glycosylase II